MSKHWLHWCPSGKCGKSVVYIHRGYFCNVCKKEFSKEELNK